MTIRTVISIISIFLFVFIIHLVLRVARRTRPRCRVAARMAFGAIPIRILVVNWECMVKCCALEAVRIVAIRTLPRKMILRRRMAALTIRQSVMAEIHIAEIIRIHMTVTTGAGVMVCRRTVTRRTILIANAAVVKHRILEVVRIGVTVLASPLVMVCRRAVA